MNIKEIIDRVNAATPGPWEWEIDPVDRMAFLASTDPDVIGGVVIWAMDPTTQYATEIMCSKADKEFIAHAREDMRLLINFIFEQQYDDNLH